MKNYIKLAILATLMAALGNQTSCMDGFMCKASGVQAYARFAQTMLAEPKKKAEISQETAKFWVTLKLDAWRREFNLNLLDVEKNRRKELIESNARRLDPAFDYEMCTQENVTNIQKALMCKENARGALLKIIEHAWGSDLTEAAKKALANIFEVFSYQELDPDQAIFCRLINPCNPALSWNIKSNAAIRALLRAKANPNFQTDMRSLINTTDDYGKGLLDQINMGHFPRKVVPLALCICTRLKPVVAAERIQLLLQHNADIHIKDNCGESILTSVIDCPFMWRNIDLTALKALLNAGVDITYTNVRQLEHSDLKGKNLSNYEQLCLFSETKNIMDDHRIALAQTSYQNARAALKATNVIPVAGIQKLVSIYAIQDPLARIADKFPLPTEIFIEDEPKGAS